MLIAICICTNRIKKQNALLMGLWLGKDKPEMSLFLKPFVLKLKHLYEEGEYF